MGIPWCACTGCKLGWVARPLLAALALLVLCGCPDGTFGPPKPKGLVRLGNKCLLILPFATPNRKHFESQLGKTFSLAVADLVREGCPVAKVIDATEIPGTVDGQTVEEMPIGIIGKALGAQYVAVGEINDLRSKAPNSFKVLHGTLVLSARVFDVADGTLVWQFSRRTFHWPRLLSGEELPAPTQDEEEVIRNVMREGAWAVAAVFRGPRSSEQLRLGE